MSLEATFDRGKYIKVSGYNCIYDRWDIFEETHLIVVHGISYEGCIDILWLVAPDGRITRARLKCMPFRHPLLLIQNFNGTLACHPYEGSQLFLVADMIQSTKEACLLDLVRLYKMFLQSTNPESAEKYEKMSVYQ